MCHKCTEFTRSDEHQVDDDEQEDGSTMSGGGEKSVAEEKGTRSRDRPKLVTMSTAEKSHLAPVESAQDSTGGNGPESKEDEDHSDKHDPTAHSGPGPEERDGGKLPHSGESTFGSRPSPQQQRSDLTLNPATCSGHGASLSRAWAKPTFNEVRREVRFASPPYPEHIASASPDEKVEWLVRNCQILWGPIRDMLGYDPGDIEPTFDWWAERTHPEDLVRLKGEIWEYCLPKTNRGSAEARLWDGVYRFKKNDGEWVTLGDRMNTIRSDEGYPTLAESYM
jgi:hypothetical protein